MKDGPTLPETIGAVVSILWRLPVLVLLVLVLWSALDGCAHAMTVTGPGPFQEWADEALVPTPEISVQVQPEGDSCGRPVLGCVYPGYSQVIYLELDPALAFSLRQTFYHEVGHLFDYSRQVTSTPESAESFADTYARCAMKPLRLIQRQRLRAACIWIRSL